MSSLSSLVVSSGTLSPSFQANTLSYYVVVPNTQGFIQITATMTSSVATLTIGGAAAISAIQSNPIALNTGNTTITVVVMAQNTSVTTTYSVVVNRTPSKNIHTFLCNK